MKIVAAGFLAGFIVLMVRYFALATAEVIREECRPDPFPDLDDVTKWQLHKEVRAILEGPDAVQ